MLDDYQILLVSARKQRSTSAPEAPARPGPPARPAARPQQEPYNKCTRARKSFVEPDSTCSNPPKTSCENPNPESVDGRNPAPPKQHTRRCATIPHHPPVTPKVNVDESCPVQDFFHSTPRGFWLAIGFNIKFGSARVKVRHPQSGAGFLPSTVRGYCILSLVFIRASA